MKNKSLKGNETRRRILETAANLMYKNGVNGTSVDDVLKASGTGKSQLYHYFGSKEQLVKEVIAWHLEAMPSAKESMLTKLDTLDGIDAWLDQTLNDYETGLYRDGCPIGNLASELAGTCEELRVSLEGTFAHWEASLAHGLKIMKGRGQLRKEASPDEMAIFCVASIEGALLLAKTQKSAVPLKSSLEQLKRYIRSFAGGASTQRPPSRRHLAISFCP